MKIVDAFIGTAQSKFAAIAILVAVLVVCITMLFSKEKVPIEQKLLMAVILFVVSLPSILYILFQMTCIVTGDGGKGGATWWCGIYAWILLAIIVVYAIMVVIIAILSVTSEKSIKETETFYSNIRAYEKFASEIVNERMPAVPSTPAPRPRPAAPSPAPKQIRAEEPQAIGGADTIADVPYGVVSATVEKFTSCGAEIPAQQATR